MSTYKSKKEKLIVPELYSEEYLQSKEGEKFPEDFGKSASYKHTIRSDTDVYGVDSNGKKRLLAKFRKSLIPLDVCETALVNLKKAAMRKNDNRGAAGGVLDRNKLPKYVKGLAKAGKFRTVGYINADGRLINSSLGNISQSNIIGFYDKADRNLGRGAPKCRLTAFTAKEVEKWDQCVPFFQHADACFQALVPDLHKSQWDRAHETEFVVPNTSFSTITINYNWRTALHKDDGDFKDGFGNLLILEEGKYEGGYLGFPRYGVCFDVRMGDFLAMDVHEWHCNTPIKGITDDFTRLSVVCYLREKMEKCKETTLAESIARSDKTLLKKQENHLREDGYISNEESSFSEEQDNQLYNKR
jgi:hypothetical protein